MGTVLAMWRDAVAERRPYPAFLAESAQGWRPVSWDAADVAIDELAAGFLELGVEPRARVAIVARTRVEWTLCDLALASVGAVTVPVYPTASTAETRAVLHDAGVRVAIVEDAEQYAKVASAGRSAGVETLVSLDAPPGSAHALEDVRARGQRSLAGGGHATLDERRAAVGDDDLLTIVYTSGTTGAPKGCCILHRHYRAMVEMVAAVPGLFAGEDRVLLFLPLAHTFARLVQYAGVGAGFTTAFCRDAADVPQALQAVRPTIFPSVPRVFEKTYDAVSGAFAEASGARGKLVRWALGVGRSAGAHRLAGRPVLPRRLRLQHALADRLVYSKVKARLGGELRYAISGGAPLSATIAAFLHSLDIVVLEGYGLTECTTASHFNQPSRYRFGTVGLPLPDVETRLGDDGEILLRTPTMFAGYWNDDEATRAVLDANGWLHTGDVGSIDADGFLTITDRKKDLIVTSGGKNVAPQPIEAALAASPFVAQALVIGDGRPYLVALLVPDAEAMAAAGIDGDPRALLERAVADTNRDLGRIEQIKRFAVLEQPFSIERGELTPTLKLRRRICEEHARDEIEALYAAPLPGRPDR